jgi:hypothetical protein
MRVSRQPEVDVARRFGLPVPRVNGITRPAVAWAGVFAPPRGFTGGPAPGRPGGWGSSLKRTGEGLM